ncbi:MAG: hypothetical protein G01um101430_10 [Parcubacteria group bacterium Gr01-1014_30]|nr:MAG: hypothetical protein G01um101430_10 [Parcubacteria group bacterium Gr01-1014_30]
MSRKGFTLIEILVYIAALVIIGSAVITFLIWAINSSTKASVMRETADNARIVMGAMSYEIKEAISVYTPTTLSNQLSLETLHYLPPGETTTYIDFYLCETQLCLKKESQSPIALTSDRVEVTNLVFKRVVTGEIPSIRIELELEFKNQSNRPEYQASASSSSTISLRSY